MIITAHSGCEGTPMNSREYLKKAVSIHPDALEVDVRRENGVLVLDHDGNDSGKKTVSFCEALEMVSHTDLRINADLKEPGLEQAAVADAEAYGFQPERLIFTGCIGNQAGMLAAVHGADVFANVEEFDPQFYHRRADSSEEEEISYLKNLCSAIRQCGFRVINIDYRFCGRLVMQACRRADLGISLWTVDRTEEAERFLDSRYCDRIVNITTNHPQALFDLIGRHNK